jgi:hypothetical protein
MFPPDTLVAHSADRVYVPTLSELIEACDDQFRLLERHNSPAAPWTAHTLHVGPAIGNTPEEAVARLWLALNENV